MKSKCLFKVKVGVSTISAEGSYINRAIFCILRCKLYRLSFLCVLKQQQFLIYLFVVRQQPFSDTAGFMQEGELKTRLSWLLIDIVVIVIITATCSFAEQLLV